MRRLYSASVIGFVAGSPSVRASSLNWSQPVAAPPENRLDADVPANGFAWTTLRVYDDVRSTRGYSVPYASRTCARAVAMSSSERRTA